MDKPEISDNTIAIPSDVLFLAAVDDFIYEKFGQRGIPKATIADFAISVSEIVNNAIEYGSQGDRQKPVTVTIDFSNSEAVITIRDQGPGFDPGNLPDPLEKDNLLKQVGRGIFIVKSLMSSVEFNITAKGTEVVMKKSLND